MPQRKFPDLPFTIAVTSGKGGVGKSNVVINLAIALAELGKQVTVLDGDLSLANIDVLLGLMPRFHIGHSVWGYRALPEITIEGPAGIRILPASSGLPALSELTQEQRFKLIAELADLLREDDYLIVDTSAGISSNVTSFLHIADMVIIVCIEEPTSLVDAYAVIKVLINEERDKDIRVLVNLVESSAGGERVFNNLNLVVERFLHRRLRFLGSIYRDKKLCLAVEQQRAILKEFPSSPASRCFREIAARIAGGSCAGPEDDRAAQVPGGLERW